MKLKKTIKLLLGFFLILVGSVSLSLTMVKSGLVYPFGMGFWGPNGHDGIWHISLINQLGQFSLNHPTFSGSKLTNYHFGFDFVVALLSRLTGIIPVTLYFQILPPVLAITIGLLTYLFVDKWTNSKAKAWWAVFFVYFGGSWGWIVNLIREGKLGGESIFWANQSISALINPPYAFSLIILMLGLIKFLDYRQNPSFQNLAICSLLFGVLIQVKVYLGIIILGSMLVLTMTSSILYRDKIWNLLKLFVLSFLLSLAVFLPFNVKSSSLLVFSPLWFPRTMLAYSDRLGWFRLENARIAYLNSGKWLKWLLTESLAISIFIFGNLGTRAIGLFYGGWLTKIKKRPTEVEILLFSGIIISLILPLLFIQQGNPWNTIQFFYYFQFFMAILAGVFVGGAYEEKARGSERHIIYVALGIVVLLTIPTTLATLKNDYLTGRPPARVSIEELHALQFLKNQPSGVVLTYPYHKEWWSKFSEPRPLYVYETTAYVSALSGKQTYLEDEMNLEISGYNWRSKREEEVRFFTTNDLQWASQFLEKNKIKYIYLVKGQKMNLGMGNVNAEKIFENGEATIVEVK